MPLQKDMDDFRRPARIGLLKLKIEELEARQQAGILGLFEGYALERYKDELTKLQGKK